MSKEQKLLKELIKEMLEANALKARMSFMNSMKGNMDPNNPYGLKNLIAARNQNPQFADEIQAMIDNHPKTLKSRFSMGKA